MMYRPEKILAEIKSFLSVEDGDLIMTGTPAGVGPVHAGDRFTGKIFDKDELLVEASWVVQ
jgi:2-keto-4-pentenoate hydratase/2-oxohepta-3-ene-1,7-dioic acid hydratase in catechol pathway